MVFASLVFLYLFLPLNLIIYFALPTVSLRNICLVVFSLFFYAWGEPVWVSLLLLTATTDFIHGIIIEKFRDRIWAKVALISCLTINLSLLGVFKYAGLIVETLNSLLPFLELDVPKVALPIGISFYTFQSISYVADVYKGQLKAERSYLNFLMFVSLYPQLVAGPIVRYSTIANELSSRQVTLQDMSKAVTRFCMGLFKKVCIANVAGELVKKFMEQDTSTLCTLDAWFGVTMYALQIYFDFSAYSDMAIALGWMFGFHYLENFNYPYIARSASEFWRRWHISLQTFFRDYVYIPLGGNRHHLLRNLFVVWFLTGLWHGASWNFVLWGLYYGFLIAVERYFLLRILEKLPRAFGHIYLIFAVLVGWVLFYFDDLLRVRDYYLVMFGFSESPLVSDLLLPEIKQNLFWLLLSIILCLPVYQVVKPHLERLEERFRLFLGPGLALSNATLLIVATAMLVGKTYNPFIYFRF
jgi:alginate O-acetyltransferase complex protein AlgI